MLITRDDVIRVAFMPQADYDTHVADLRRRKDAAYARYCSVGIRSTASQFTRVTGHGSWVCDVDPQGLQRPYLVASELLRDTEQVRRADCWKLFRTYEEAGLTRAVMGYLPYTNGREMAQVLIDFPYRVLATLPWLCS